MIVLVNAEGAKKPLCDKSFANLWFYYPFRRIPRKDQFEWVEDVPALIFAIPSSDKEYEKRLLGPSDFDINSSKNYTDPSNSEIHSSIGNAEFEPSVKKHTRRRHLHFGGREFKFACNGTTGVILNHGCDLTKG